MMYVGTRWEKRRLKGGKNVDLWVENVDLWVGKRRLKGGKT